jgi:hypothetical protein
MTTIDDIYKEINNTLANKGIHINLKYIISLNLSCEEEIVEFCVVSINEDYAVVHILCSDKYITCIMVLQEIITNIYWLDDIKNIVFLLYEINIICVQLWFTNKESPTLVSYELWDEKAKNFFQTLKSRIYENDNPKPPYIPKTLTYR